MCKLLCCKELFRIVQVSTKRTFSCFMLLDSVQNYLGVCELVGSSVT